WSPPALIGAPTRWPRPWWPARRPLATRRGQASPIGETATQARRPTPSPARFARARRRRTRRASRPDRPTRAPRLRTEAVLVLLADRARWPGLDESRSSRDAP